MDFGIEGNEVSSRGAGLKQVGLSAVNNAVDGQKDI